MTQGSEQRAPSAAPAVTPLQSLSPDPARELDQVRSTRTRLTSNVVLLGSAEGIARAIALATSLVIARILGPTLFGGVALAQVVVLYLAALGDGGLTVWTQRQIVLRKDRLPELVSETMAVQLILGAIAAVALCGIAVAAPLPSGTPILIVAATPFAITQALSTVYALQALERMRAAAIVRVTTQVATAIAAGVVVTTHKPLLIVTTLWVGQLVGSVQSVYMLRRGSGFRFTRPRLAGVRQTLLAGLPLLGSIALYQYISAFVSFALGTLRKSSDVGVYNAAARLMFLAPAVLLVVGNAIYPEMIRRYSQDPKHLGEFIERALVVAARITFVAAALIAALSRPLIGLLYGAKYERGAPVLRILAFLFPVFCFALLGTLAFVAAGMNRRNIAAMAIAASASTVIAPIAIATAGLTGAAGATLAAQTILCISMGVLGRSLMPRRALTSLPLEIGFGLSLAVASLAIVHYAHISSSFVSTLVVIGVAAVIETARGFPTVRAVRGGAAAYRPKHGA